MYLQNRCQRRSGMLEICRPFGQYAVHTNLAKVHSRQSSVTSVSSQSMHSALMTSSSDSMNSLNQVALPIRANLPMLSAPENAWNAGKAFAFSGHVHDCTSLLVQRQHTVLGKFRLAIGRELLSTSSKRMVPSVASPKNCHQKQNIIIARLYRTVVCRLSL